MLKKESRGKTKCWLFLAILVIEQKCRNRLNLAYKHPLYWAVFSIFRATAWCLCNSVNVLNTSCLIRGILAFSFVSCVLQKVLETTVFLSHRWDLPPFSVWFHQMSHSACGTVESKAFLHVMDTVQAKGRDEDGMMKRTVRYKNCGNIFQFGKVVPQNIST